MCVLIALSRYRIKHGLSRCDVCARLDDEMPRVLVTVRVPSAAVWQLFRHALLRDRGTMQKWVQGAVLRALEAGRAKGRGRRGRPGWGGKTEETWERARGPVRQVVARLEAAHLARLRSICEDEGIRLSEWLLDEIGRYVETQTIMNLVGADVRSKLRGYLASGGIAQERIVRILMVWPDEVVLEALAHRPYNLREAIRAKDLDLIADILEVANMKRQLREKSENVQRRVKALLARTEQLPLKVAEPKRPYRRKSN